MKAMLLLLLSLMTLPVIAGNYQLQYGNVFQSCSFIHEDDYSVSSLTSSIKNMLETKLEGDRACNATFNKLHTEMLNIDKILNQKVSKVAAQEIYHETYSKYLQDLTQESLVLDTSDPDQKMRHQSLTQQIDAMKLSLLNNQFSLQLNKENFHNDKSNNFRSDLYGYAAGMFTALNQAPVNCIDKLGGWDQMLPAVLKVGGMIGSSMGGPGPIIGAGFVAASQLAILLQNVDLKTSISNIERRRNEAILACTYQSLQSTACELNRADKFVSNQEKINDIIFNRFAEGPYGEYERYYKAMQLFPKLQDILSSIGKMGSAITLDQELITKYIAAVAIDPSQIVIPADTSTDLEIKSWLVAMKRRGIKFNEVNYSNGQPYTIREQFTIVKDQVSQAIVTISTVTDILKENRSFLDLHSELMKNGAFLSKEVTYLKKFLTGFLIKENFPPQYRGVFSAADKMLYALNSFLSVSHSDDETFEREVNAKGFILFQTMAKGSVAQINAQSILMIPEIAFQRLTRPFESIEQYYLNQDIEHRDNPEHASFSDFVIHKSLQIKVTNDYQVLSGSNKAHRMEQYETTRKSFEKGFKKEIYKMVNYALDVKSSVLPTFEGKTAAHMCALFAGFLRQNYPRTYRECRKEHKTLDLLNVLSGFDKNKKKEMAIDYEKPCFYNDYKREENGQRILFERLKDYGNKDL